MTPRDAGGLTIAGLLLVASCPATGFAQGGVDCLHRKDAVDELRAFLGAAPPPGPVARCGQNAYGYYDSEGRWVSNRATTRGYEGPNGHWVDAPPPDADTSARLTDTRQAESRMAARIDRGLADGSLERGAAARALRALNDVRNIDADYREGDDGGALTPGQYRDVAQRLQALGHQLQRAVERASSPSWAPRRPPD